MRRDAWRSRTVGIWLAIAVAVPACRSDPAMQPAAATPSATAATYGHADVGGYELTWTCQGSGSPTIVAEAGYDSPGTGTFYKLMQPLSEISRVCTYDRAGTGSSDDRPDGLHVTGMLQADELHSLLGAAATAPPYVVVAHSYGGFIARLFAAAYPSGTAGLVLLDSSHEGEIPAYRRFYGNSQRGDWVDGGDLIDIDATQRALRSTARDFGDMPLVVIKAGYYQDVLTVALWDRTQADLATLSSDAVLMQAQGGHYVMNDDPNLVLAAVRAVVASVRTGSALPSCPGIVADTDGRCP